MRRRPKPAHVLQTLIWILSGRSGPEAVHVQMQMPFAQVKLQSSICLCLRSSASSREGATMVEISCYRTRCCWLGAVRRSAKTPAKYHRHPVRNSKWRLALEFLHGGWGGSVFQSPNHADSAVLKLRPTFTNQPIATQRDSSARHKQTFIFRLQRCPNVPKSPPFSNVTD